MPKDQKTFRCLVCEQFKGTVNDEHWQSKPLHQKPRVVQILGKRYTTVSQWTLCSINGFFSHHSNIYLPIYQESFKPIMDISIKTRFFDKKKQAADNIQVVALGTKI